MAQLYDNELTRKLVKDCQMPRFSQASNNRLLTCDGSLVLLFDSVIEIIDCTILCGARSKDAQNESFRTGHSKVEWPNGKHNVREEGGLRSDIMDMVDLPNLSRAVDAAPYPIDWKDYKRFYHFAGVVRAVARQLDIQIRWGGDWDGDFDFSDQTFDDLVHFEIRG
jgi:peptidoglycan L-alanyl-D-glutamate endopeptidase CwlK